MTETRPSSTHLQHITKRAKHFRRKRAYAQEFDAAGFPGLALDLRNCQETESLVCCSHCSSHWWALTKCRKRVCPLCSFEESRKRGQFLIAMCAKMKFPKMITLTMALWEGDPHQGIALLRNSFTKLRRQDLLKTVQGGAYQIELKQKPTGWHIHMHAIVDAPFIPYQKLYTAWKRITNQAHVEIDVRAAKTQAAIAYSCKYASKASSFDTPGHSIVAWYLATKGERLFATFGTFYNATLHSIDPEQFPEPKPYACPVCNSVGTIFYARDGPFIYGPREWGEVAFAFGAEHDHLRKIDGAQDAYSTTAKEHTT